MNQTPDPIQPDLVQTAPDGSPLRQDGTPYPEGMARGGADFTDNTQQAPAPIETTSEIVPEKSMGESAMAAFAGAHPAQPADAFSLTVDTDEKSKILHVAIGDGTTDRIPFVCLPQISAFAELAVVEAQVEISEMVETMRNSDANQGNGRLAVSILTQLFDFFSHYLYPSELERMRHLMGAQTAAYGPGAIMHSITRDQATAAMKDLLELYGNVETVADGAITEEGVDEGNGGGDSSPSPAPGPASTTNSPS